MLISQIIIVCVFLILVLYTAQKAKTSLIRTFELIFMGFILLLMPYEAIVKTEYNMQIVYILLLIDVISVYIWVDYKVAKLSNLCITTILSVFTYILKYVAASQDIHIRILLEWIDNGIIPIIIIWLVSNMAIEIKQYIMSQKES